MARIAPTNAGHYRAPLAQALASSIVPTLRQLHQGRINTIVSSPDGKLAVSGSQDGTAVLFDLASLETVRPIPSLYSVAPVTAAAFDPSGGSVLIVSSDGQIQVWKPGSGPQWVAHVDGIEAAIFSPDARLVATASSDKTARLWDLSSGKEIITILGHTGGVLTLAFSPDGRRLVTGGRDGTARVWDTVTGRELRVLAEHTKAITAATFSPDGRFLLTGSNDETARIWDLSDEKSNSRKLIGHTSGINAISLSADGSRIYVIDFGGNAYIWDFKTAHIIVASVSVTTENYGLASFGLRGNYAAIPGKAGVSRVWDADAARTILTLREQKAYPMSAMMWSEQRLFVGDAAGIVSAYDLQEHTEPISRLVSRACKNESFSPRFTWIESATDPLIRQAWDPEGTARSVCASD